MKTSQISNSLLFNALMWLSSLIMLSSCEEVIQIDLNEANPKLVVQGFVYDTPGRYRIRLTLTSNYFDTASAPKVNNAFVTITEDGNLIDTLLQEEPGIYKTQKITQGKIGSTYTLNILYDGQLYEATATLKPSPAIDSLTYAFVEESLVDDEGYYVSIYFQDPAEIGNYYLWKLFANNKQREGRDELNASDELYNGNYISFEFDQSFALNDTVRVEMFSTDRAGYTFFNQLDEQDNTGDLFDTPPGNVQGNISNGGIGYFGAMQKVKKEIIIE